MDQGNYVTDREPPRVFPNSDEFWSISINLEFSTEMHYTNYLQKGIQAYA